MRVFHRSIVLTFASTLLIAPGSSIAADVSLGGIIANTCVLSITSAGTLAPLSDGQTLTSETTGGAAATMAIIAAGLSPTIKFGAPTVQAPSGWTGSPTTSVRYTSIGGANQAYSSAATQATAGALLDVFTVNAKVENHTGFAAGQYTVHTIVTCQQ